MKDKICWTRHGLSIAAAIVWLCLIGWFTVPYLIIPLGPRVWISPIILLSIATAILLILNKHGKVLLILFCALELFLSLTSMILYLPAFIFMDIMYGLNLIKKDKTKKYLEKVWFLPAIFTGLLFIVALIGMMSSGEDYGTTTVVITFLPFLAFSILFGLFCIKTKALPKEEYLKIKNENKQRKEQLQQQTKEKRLEQAKYNYEQEKKGYITPIKHIFLIALLYPIYLLIWIYKTTKYVNSFSSKYRNPWLCLILSFFIPFYIIIWTYKSAKEIDRHSKKHGIPEDIFTLTFILSIFIPILAIVFLQLRINAIVYNINNGVPEIRTFSIADEIIKLKKLFDDKIITNDEYEKLKFNLINNSL